MKFSESGLPSHRLVESAFEYSQKNILSRVNDEVRIFTQQVNMSFTQNLMMLDLEKQAGGMSDEEYKREKEQMDRLREQQIKIGPQLIEKELRNIFVTRRVGPAKELVTHADAPGPELLAAVMLVDCVRSPLDYKNVAEKFGPGVADLVAEIVHIDAYPSERVQNLGRAGVDTKRAYTALMISSMEQVLAQVERAAKAKPAQKIVFPPGQEEQIFSDARLIWGADPKLEKRFLDAFNKASTAVSSPYRLEVDAAGALEFVKGATAGPGPKIDPKKPKPNDPKPPGNGSIGGDVF